MQKKPRKNTTRQDIRVKYNQEHMYYLRVAITKHSELYQQVMEEPNKSGLCSALLQAYFQGKIPKAILEDYLK